MTQNLGEFPIKSLWELGAVCLSVPGHCVPAPARAVPSGCAWGMLWELFGHHPPALFQRMGHCHAAFPSKKTPPILIFSSFTKSSPDARRGEMAADTSAGNVPPGRAGTPILVRMILGGHTQHNRKPLLLLSWQNCFSGQ